MPLTTPSFPLYLIPSIPFRRRCSSAETVLTISASSSPSSSPPQPTSYLTPRPASHLQCSKCLSHLIPASSIISKGFTGRYGRAYLCAPPPSQPPTNLDPTFLDACAPGDLPNTLTGKPMPRQLVTGAHTVSDITCKICGSVLGWKYVEAKEETQKYKVGKYILETKRVVRSPGWDAGDDLIDGERDEIVDEDVEFDSQDEDECEDLFMGVWSKELAVKRRRNKTFS